jgi:REP element-mobilizing transposase RayT
MSRNYKFHNPKGLYFVSFAVVNWLDVFTRNKYKDILLESLSYCQKEKGMEIVAWCIMTNHVHLIFRSVNGIKPEILLGDFKRFTSKKIVKAIENNLRESRREYLLEMFEKAAAKSQFADMELILVGQPLAADAFNIMRGYFTGKTDKITGRPYSYITARNASAVFAAFSLITTNKEGAVGISNLFH